MINLCQDDCKFIELERIFIENRVYIHESCWFIRGKFCMFLYQLYAIRGFMAVLFRLSTSLQGQLRGRFAHAFLVSFIIGPIYSLHENLSLFM